MKVYMTRHGQTLWNKEGKMQGWKNSDLSEKGIDNAIKLGKSLNHIDFDCIYSSPLGRALDTAKYIRGNKDTQIIINESLKEMGFGQWEGMNHIDVEELYPQEHYNFWNKPHLYKPVEGETFEELLSRVRKVLDEIINNSLANTVLIVAHAVVIKGIYAIVKNYSLEDFWKPPFMHDTSLSIIEVKDDGVEFILEADLSHLSGE